MRGFLKAFVRSLDTWIGLKGMIRALLGIVPNARWRYKLRALIEKQWSTQIMWSNRGFIYPSNQEIGIFVDEFGFHGREIADTLQKYVANPTVIVEIGANIGSDTMGLAHRFPGSTVYAFEPVRTFLSCLYWNAPQNVHVEPYAISSVTGGTIELNVSMNSASRVDNVSRSFPTVRRQIAETKTLDAYVDEHALPTIDFIKTDTDGNECEVLIGAAKTISRFRPFLFVEFSQDHLEKLGRSTDELADLLVKLGYSQFIVFHGHNALSIPASAADLKSKLPRHETANVFALPQARLAGSTAA